MYRCIREIKRYIYEIIHLVLHIYGHIQGRKAATYQEAQELIHMMLKCELEQGKTLSGCKVVINAVVHYSPAWPNLGGF